MAVGTDLLQAMNDVDSQFNVTANATVGYRLLNHAQNLLESEIAKRAKLFQTDDTIVTAATTEKTARPATLRRIDSVVMENDSSRPWFEMDAVHNFMELRANRHRLPAFLVAQVAGSGRPYKYFLDSTDFYWGPTDPDAVYTIRVLGFYEAAEITAVATFGYPDSLIIPVAAAALVLFRTGVEDATQDHLILQLSHLTPALDAFEHEWKHGTRHPNYSEIHLA